MSYPFDALRPTPEEFRLQVEANATEAFPDVLAQVSGWFSVFSGIAEGAIGFQADGSKQIEIGLPDGNTKWLVSNRNITTPRLRDEGRSPFVTVEVYTNNQQTAQVSISENNQIAMYTPTEKTGVRWFGMSAFGKVDQSERIVERATPFVQPLFAFLTQPADEVMVNGVRGVSSEVSAYVTTQYEALRTLVASQGQSTNKFFPHLYEWILKKEICVNETPITVTLAQSPLNEREGPVKVYLGFPNPNFIYNPDEPHINRSITTERYVSVEPTSLTSRHSTSLNIGKRMVEDHFVTLERGRRTNGRDLVEFAALQPYLEAIVNPELTQS